MSTTPRARSSGSWSTCCSPRTPTRSRQPAGADRLRPGGRHRRDAHGRADHLRELNPDAVVEVYGQELNPETWAIARSDLMMRGDDPERMAPRQLASPTTRYPATRFDYMLANPPFGVDWKAYADPIKAEATDHGRRRPLRRRAAARSATGRSCSCST